MFVGYLALRAFVEDPQRRGQWSAAVGILGAINVPIVWSRCAGGGHCTRCPPAMQDMAKIYCAGNVRERVRRSMVLVTIYFIRRRYEAAASCGPPSTPRKPRRWEGTNDAGRRNWNFVIAAYVIDVGADLGYGLRAASAALNRARAVRSTRAHGAACPVTARGSTSKKQLAPILVGAVARRDFGWLLYGGLDKNVVFFLTPKELLAKGPSAYDVPVQLGGQVKPGTVQWDEKTLHLQFEVTDGAGTDARARDGRPAADVPRREWASWSRADSAATTCSRPRT